MRAYAERAGVIAKRRLILEEYSMETIGNAYYIKQILDERRWQSVRIVTSEFHLPRAQQTFEHVFGRGYKLQYESVASNFSPQERRHRARIEANIVHFTAMLLHSVEPGNEQATYEAIQRLPGYNSEPEFSRGQLRKLVGAGTGTKSLYGSSGNEQ